LYSINGNGLPPYYVDLRRKIDEDDDGQPIYRDERWFLEQDKLIPKPSQKAWDDAAKDWS